MASRTIIDPPLETPHWTAVATGASNGGAAAVVFNTSIWFSNASNEENNNIKTTNI